MQLVDRRGLVDATLHLGERGGQPAGIERDITQHLDADLGADRGRRERAERIAQLRNCLSPLDEVRRRLAYGTIARPKTGEGPVGRGAGSESWWSVWSGHRTILAPPRPQSAATPRSRRASVRSVHPGHPTEAIGLVEDVADDGLQDVLEGDQPDPPIGGVAHGSDVDLGTTHREQHVAQRADRVPPPASGG